MISVEQIRVLESRVNNACELIGRLKKENATLRKAVEGSRSRMMELETFITQFKVEQKEIESSIVNALKKLDELEDDVSDVSVLPSGKSDPPSLSLHERSGSLGADNAVPGDSVPVDETGAGKKSVDDHPISSNGRQKNEHVPVDEHAGEQEEELDIF